MRAAYTLLALAIALTIGIAGVIVYFGNAPKAPPAPPASSSPAN